MQNYKEQRSIVHQFSCFCMENHLWKFHPKWRSYYLTIWMPRINAANNKNSGILEKRYCHARRPRSVDSFLQWLFTWQKLLNIFEISLTLSEKAFTISPRNLALIAFYPPTFLPSTFNNLSTLIILAQNLHFRICAELAYIQSMSVAGFCVPEN